MWLGVWGENYHALLGGGMPLAQLQPGLSTWEGEINHLSYLAKRAKALAPQFPLAEPATLGDKLNSHHWRKTTPY